MERVLPLPRSGTARCRTAPSPLCPGSARASKGSDVQAGARPEEPGVLERLLSLPEPLRSEPRTAFGCDGSRGGDGKSPLFLCARAHPPSCYSETMTASHERNRSEPAPGDSERWKHDGVRVIPGHQLDPNVPSTPGMDRKAAINFARAGAQKLWAGTVTIKPDAKTGAHHHGHLESIIYVVRGRARMR